MVPEAPQPAGHRAAALAAGQQMADHGAGLARRHLAAHEALEIALRGMNGGQGWLCALRRHALTLWGAAVSPKRRWAFPGTESSGCAGPVGRERRHAATENDFPHPCHKK